MIISYIELALLLSAALVSDFRTYRIDNRIILVFLTAGLATGLALEGPSGLLSSFLGMALPLPLLFWLYPARMLGAGDIKLFCAAGAVMGIGFIPWCIAWSFLGGGLTALALMLARRNFRQRFRYLGGYLKACFLSGSILEYSELSDKSDGAKFHFSLAIALGSAVQVSLTLFL